MRFAFVMLTALAMCTPALAQDVKTGIAAWSYPAPKDAAAEIKGRIAFWKGVEVSAS